VAAGRGIAAASRSAIAGARPRIAAAMHVSYDCDMRPIFRGFLAVLWGALACASCGRNAPTAPAAAAAAASIADTGKPRIISTVPAATLNLVLIGAADELVGVSKYDLLYLPDAQKDLPVVGDYETMNYEQLVKLKPTTLVIQFSDVRVPPRLRELAAAQHFDLVSMHFDHVSDIWDSVRALGKISGKEKDADNAIVKAQLSLKDVTDQYKDAPHPKVAYLISPKLMLLSGDKTFVHEMIVAAGGEDVGAKVGDSFVEIGMETLVKLQPEVLLLGAVEEMGEVQNDPRIARWSDLPIPAAKNHRIYLVTDGNSQMASVNIGKNVRELARMIHAGDAGGKGGGGDKP